MSRVHIDPSLNETIEEEETQSLSPKALADHELGNQPLSCSRHARGRHGAADVSSSERSSDFEQKRARRMSRRALDVTRRLSVSAAMFGHLHGLLARGEDDEVSGPPKYENTYRTEPKEDERFLAKEVADIASAVLRQKLADVPYEAKSCARLCCSLANVIRIRILDNLDLPRYKLIVNVLIGQRNNQSIQVASRCLWNEQTDRCASASYQNRSLFAVATVHGLYFE